MPTVLITGIGKGIGRALAQKFKKEGFPVVGTYFAADPSRVSESGITTYALDLSSPESISTCAKEMISAGHQFDIHINNAGVLLDEEETRVVVEKLWRTLQINLLGTIDFTERLLTCLKPAGHIVNISSTAGSLTLAGQAISHFPYHYPSYKISKAALNMYTRTLALRLKDQGTIVSSVHPGWVQTDMGGMEAKMTPEEAAGYIFDLAISRPETGGFWHAGKPLPW